MTDLGALDRSLHGWLCTVALPGQRLVHAVALSGGYRTDNLALTTGTGERFVLRRYPLGNACAVEAALAARCSGVVPVAAVVAADPDGAVAGEPVLLSRFVPGTPVDRVLDGARGGEAAGLGHAVGAALAAIGTVRFERPGFFAGPDLMPGPAGTDPTDGLPAFVERCIEAGAGRALSAAERDGLLALASRSVPALEAVRGARQLVHADFNPKNLLATIQRGRWTVSAVLDWEFAYSSSPLFDVGNMLRHHGEQPVGYRGGFVEGLADGGAELPENWPEIARALDLFALADLLTRPGHHPLYATVLATVRARLAA